MKASGDNGPSLPNQHKARKPAWGVLEAQNPDHLECYHCKTHHRLSDIYKFVAFRDRPDARTACMRLDLKYRTAKFIHPDFHFTVFRMVMKQFRLTGNSTKLLHLLSYRSGVLEEGSQVKQIIATPKIVAGRLFMRVQTAYVVPPGHANRLCLANKNHLLCPHSAKHSPGNSHLALGIVKKYATLETLPEGRQQTLLSAECVYCITKFRIDLTRFEGEGTMLLITKWQDLGTGLSPLESDIPSLIGPPLYLHPLSAVHRLIPESWIADYNLDPSSSLTPEERAIQFRKCESKHVQMRRATEAFGWRWWRHVCIFPHQQAAEYYKRSMNRATNASI